MPDVAINFKIPLMALFFLHVLE